MSRKKQMMDKIQGLMCKPEMIRNIGIVAHDRPETLRLTSSRDSFVNPSALGRPV